MISLNDYIKILVNTIGQKKHIVAAGYAKSDGTIDGIRKYHHNGQSGVFCTDVNAEVQERLNNSVFHVNGVVIPPATNPDGTTTPEVVIPPVTPPGSVVDGVAVCKWDPSKPLHTLTRDDLITGHASYRKSSKYHEFSGLPLDMFGRPGTGIEETSAWGWEELTFKCGLGTIPGGIGRWYGTKLTLPDTLTIIGDNAFNYAKLTNVVIPDSVTEIGDHAFELSKITSLVLGDSVETIGRYSFNYAELTNLVIPNSVTEIGESAFTGSKLTNLVIGDSVTTIGDNAFGNSPLTNLVIPNSVTSIDIHAFFSTVNKPTTTVSMPSRFNTPAEKSKIFGSLGWDQITFTWT